MRNGHIRRTSPTSVHDLGSASALRTRLSSAVDGVFSIRPLGNGGCGCRIGFANPIQLVSDGVNGALNWDSGIAAPPGFRPPPVLEPGVGNSQQCRRVLRKFRTGPSRSELEHRRSARRSSSFVIDIVLCRQSRQGAELDYPVEPASRPADWLLGSLLQKRIDDPEVIAAGFTKPYREFPEHSDARAGSAPLSAIPAISPSATRASDGAGTTPCKPSWSAGSVNGS